MDEDEQDEFLKRVQCRVVERVKILEKGRIEKVDKVRSRDGGLRSVNGLTLTHPSSSSLSQAFNLLRQASAETVDECLNAYDGNNLAAQQKAQQRLELLKQGITEYFEQDEQSPASLVRSGIIEPGILQAKKSWRAGLAVDVKLFVNQNADVVKSGRDVAKILHGISTPQYPAMDW